MMHDLRAVVRHEDVEVAQWPQTAPDGGAVLVDPEHAVAKSLLDGRHDGLDLRGVARLHAVPRSAGALGRLVSHLEQRPE